MRGVCAYARTGIEHQPLSGHLLVPVARDAEALRRTGRGGSGDEVSRRKRLRLQWTCSDVVYNSHRWYWTAALCGRMQPFLGGGIGFRKPRPRPSWTESTSEPPAAPPPGRAEP